MDQYVQHVHIVMFTRVHIHIVMCTRTYEVAFCGVCSFPPPSHTFTLRVSDIREPTIVPNVTTQEQLHTGAPVPPFASGC